MAVQKKKKLFKKTYLFCSKNEKLLRIYNNRQKIGIILPILTKNDYIIENTYYCLIYIGLYFFIMIFIPIITYIALNIDEILPRLDLLLRDMFFI